MIRERGYCLDLDESARSCWSGTKVGLVGLLLTSVATVIQITSTSVLAFAVAGVAAVLFSSTAILASAVVFQNVIQPSLRPSEKTIRRQFGSFRRAIQRAGLSLD